MPKLIVRIRAPENVSNTEGDVDNRYEWFVFANSGSLDASGEGIRTEMAEALSGLDDWINDPANVTVLVPGSHTLYMQAIVPGKSRSQMQKALPYVVEEFLAEELDQVHIAHRPLIRGKAVECCIVSRNLMEAWLEVLNSAGLNPGLMIADTEVLPIDGQQLHIFVGSNEALLKGPDLMLSCGRQDIVQLLDMYLLKRFPSDTHEGDDESSDDLVHTSEICIHLHNQDLEAIEKSRLEAGTRVQIDWVLHENQSLTETEYLVQRAIERQLPSRADSHRPLNLLQDRYQVLSSTSDAWLRWRSVAVMAMALCALLLITEGVKGLWIGYKADQLTEQSLALYKDIFKNDRRINAATLQRRMAAHLGENQDIQPVFLNMLGSISKVLGAQSSKPNLENLNFNSTRGELTTQLRVTDFEVLESVKTALITNGLSVDIRTAEQKGNHVIARLLLRN